jgi:glycosyltransferase involved in cell wall biosynthesis
VPFRREPDDIVAVFAGAFRPWHGAHLLAEALLALDAAGNHQFHGVFIGDGPELPRVKQIARKLPRVTFTGAIQHDLMPAALAAADIGVAPFDLAAHAPLTLSFYWSPLKVFEYMASGLPVVTPRVPRLGTLLEGGREGILYDPPDARGLTGALHALRSVEARAALGAAARERVVKDFSWQAHCERLEAALESVAGSSRKVSVRSA